MIYIISFFIGVIFTFIIWGLILSAETYTMGEVVFKSRKREFYSESFPRDLFYLHCVLRCNNTTKNFKLEVSKDVYELYKVGDGFPIKN
jgi:hypothetical protein